VRTRELYRHVLDRHVFPSLGGATLAGLSPSKIRGWHAGIAQDHPATAAKAYRLLSTVLRTAVVDGLIVSSPCKVDGAGAERAAERPIATVEEVEALAAAMPDHLRLIILMATWCQLRRGEILGLRRRDVDVLHTTIRIGQSRTFTMDGKSVVKAPKTAAGRRVIAVPKLSHGGCGSSPRSVHRCQTRQSCLSGRDGTPLTRDALQASWERARTTIGRRDLRLHDLRHTGLTLAAATGATTVELMHRAGHASAAAAMRYQHAIQDRDRVLADALEALVRPEGATRIYPRGGVQG